MLALLSNLNSVFYSQYIILRSSLHQKKYLCIYYTSFTFQLYTNAGYTHAQTP